MSAPADKPKAVPRRRWRTLLKIALLLIFIVGLISVLQILVPAVAQRDKLQAILNTSDDCKSPCFMGITPGQSTAGDVMDRFWNDNRFLVDNFLSGDGGQLNVRSRLSGDMPVYIFFIQEQVVHDITIANSGISFAAILLTLGLPSMQVDDSLIYLDDGLALYPHVCDPVQHGLLSPRMLFLRNYVRDADGEMRFRAFDLPFCNSSES